MSFVAATLIKGTCCEVDMHERRKAKRHRIEFRPGGNLTVSYGDTTWIVWMVENISPFGALIHVEANIAPGTELLVIYEDQIDTLVLKATVAWNDAPPDELEGDTGSGLFITGISFSEDDAGTPVRLFDLLANA